MSGGTSVHWLLTQYGVGDWQTWPHVPQLLASHVRLMHCPLQQVLPSLHCEPFSSPTQAPKVFGVYVQMGELSSPGSGLRM